jgi:hypothetical protein
MDYMGFMGRARWKDVSSPTRRQAVGNYLDVLQIPFGRLTLTRQTSDTGENSLGHRRMKSEGTRCTTATWTGNGGSSMIASAFHCLTVQFRN